MGMATHGPTPHGHLRRASGGGPAADVRWTCMWTCMWKCMRKCMRRVLGEWGGLLGVRGRHVSTGFVGFVVSKWFDLQQAHVMLLTPAKAHPSLPEVEPACPSVILRSLEKNMFVVSSLCPA